MTTQACPLCQAATAPSQRYPRQVCPSCASRASSADGRLLRFSNLGLSGGFIARYAGSDAVHDSHACFIDGIECWADEARFGGIVIEVAGPA